LVVEGCGDFEYKMPADGTSDMMSSAPNTIEKKGRKEHFCPVGGADIMIES
jgi:hypothetical protein